MKQTNRIIVNKYLDENETVLWTGKPNKHIYFKEEKKYLISLFLSSIYQPMFLCALLFFKNIPKIIVFILIAFSIFVLGAIRLQRYLVWLKRKTSSIFIITNINLIHYFEFDNKNHIHKKELSKLKYFHVVKTKNGGTLYYSKYRFNFATPYNYEMHAFESIQYNYNMNDKDSFNYFMSDEAYACFYDLIDSEIDEIKKIIHDHSTALEFT